MKYPAAVDERACDPVILGDIPPPMGLPVLVYRHSAKGMPFYARRDQLRTPETPGKSSPSASPNTLQPLISLDRFDLSNPKICSHCF